MKKLYDVCTRIFYTSKEGEKKTKWFRAGMVKETEDGLMYLRLYNQPQTDFFIFEKQETENQKEEF